MSAVLKNAQLRQRADYTYKFNSRSGRHGWLRLTPAYSVKIVEELIVNQGRAQRIFDPFCGTGTTALSAAYHGHESVTIDINPFLLWLTQAKTAQYSSREIAEAREACVSALSLIRKKAIEPFPIPPIRNIERWWNAESLAFLRLLRAAIQAATKEGSAEQTLLLVAFCRTLIGLSNAAFNHQSMSFKNDSQLTINLEHDLDSTFIQNAHFVLDGANENPSGIVHTFLGDSRNLTDVTGSPFDFVVTSPPYANRMSYIRELRPYMYWLGHLDNGRDAGELDWTAIGGTWGVATSRLLDWKRPNVRFKSIPLDRVLDKIAHADNKNGIILANYVAKYLDDMWMHFQGLPRLLAPEATVHYIVGNSTFYGEMVSTQLFYTEMMQAVGFDAIECKPIRKRNSKKELVEFDVIGTWHKKHKARSNEYKNDLTPSFNTFEIKKDA